MVGQAPGRSCSVAETIVEPLTQDGLKAALREARQAAAVHRETLRQLGAARSLRLAALADEVRLYFASLPEASDVFDVALGDGGAPRLWIDAVTSVVMEPDDRTYRLQEDGETGLAVLVESPDRGEILAALKTVLAHRLLERQRRAAALPGSHVTAGYSAGALALAFASGAAGALLALLAVARLFKFI